MCVPILSVHRDQAGDITHVGGSTPDGRPWGLTLAQAISRIELQVYEFVVTVPIGVTVPVLVRTRPGGRKFLTTSPDGVLSNNLDRLPVTPAPLAGVDPPFPLSIPDLLSTKFFIKDVSLARPDHTLWNDAETYYYKPEPQPPHYILVPPPIWTAPRPESIYLRAQVPFPASYQVLADWEPLERVPSDSPTRRWELEAEGKGWWTFELVLTGPNGMVDPTLPSRFTPANIVVHPPAALWSAAHIPLAIRCGTVNPFCFGRDAHTGQLYHSYSVGSVTVHLVDYPPVIPPPPPQPVRLPNVVGDRLDTALDTLWNLGLKDVFALDALGAPATEEQVTGQTPAAGTQVQLTDSIYLATRMTTPQTGVKRVLVNNQSGRGEANELWVFDYNTGDWTDHGSVGYQDNVVVDGLPDGHTCQLVSVDSSIPECRTGQPDEGDCVYQHMTSTFVADAAGVDVAWQIL